MWGRNAYFGKYDNSDRVRGPTTGKFIRLYLSVFHNSRMSTTGSVSRTIDDAVTSSREYAAVRGPFERPADEASSPTVEISFE